MSIGPTPMKKSIRLNCIQQCIALIISFVDFDFNFKKINNSIGIYLSYDEITVSVWNRDNSIRTFTESRLKNVKRK